jgi:hypothetical protein
MSRFGDHYNRAQLDVAKDILEKLVKNYENTEVCPDLKKSLRALNVGRKKLIMQTEPLVDLLKKNRKINNSFNKSK